VPPPDPTEEPVDAADRADMEALREALRAQRDRLAEVKLRLDDKTSRLDSERLARADAQRLLAHAAADRDELTALVDQLRARASEFEESFAASLRRRRRLSSAEREDFIERARLAARGPRTEREVREETDRMLLSAGWSVQDRVR
jgi:type I restriction enzyme R subunit